MLLSELIQSGHQVNVTISLKDLRDFFREINEDTPVKESIDELLTAPEVCKLLKVDNSTLWRWRKQNYLIPVNIGYHIRYKLSDIRKLING